MTQREQSSEEDESPRARLLRSLRLSDPRPTAQIRENHLAEQIIQPPTEHHHPPYRQHTSLPTDTLPHTNKTTNQSSSVETDQNPLDNPPQNIPRLDDPPSTMASPPTNPTGAKGTASTTTPLSDTTFTLRELLTAALHGPAYDIGAMLFTPAANQDTNPDLSHLLSSVHRARVDPDYAEKSARFVTEALKIQKQAAPGQGVEDAYMRMEGALDAAKRLEGGMKTILADLRREKMRPAATLSEREGRDIDAEAARLIRFPMDLRGMKEVLEEKGRGSEGEGSEMAEEEEEKGQVADEQGGMKGKNAKNGMKSKGKTASS
ncbi:hypothetical protein SLS56_010572 [Neofusicoccum ribis]|uniref:Mediator complex subunit 4 n=1 Tax=Neofusicoccum ribis TaxID=45134 RepID=A0ABR3SFH9_9PEZI